MYGVTNDKNCINGEDLIGNKIDFVPALCLQFRRGARNKNT